MEAASGADRAFTNAAFDAERDASLAREVGCQVEHFEVTRWLEHAERIQVEFKQQPSQLEYLHGIVQDFFIDWHKLKGFNVKPRLEQLKAVLIDYDMDSLIALLTSPP